MTIAAAADGSALGNPGPAGWAWYVDDGCWAAGGWPHATNNRGELQAVLELFRATAHLDDDLLVLCDSQYVINSVTKWMRGWKAKGWRKSDGKAVLNVDLLQELDAALDGRRYRFEWVKGHANHPLNEAADERARAAAEAYRRRTPVPEGPGWPGRPTAAEPDTSRVHRTAARAVVAAPMTATASTRSPASAPQPGLFDLVTDDVPETVTVRLTPAEYSRLEHRARETGSSVEEALRRLI